MIDLHVSNNWFSFTAQNLQLLAGERFDWTKTEMICSINEIIE